MEESVAYSSKTNPSPAFQHKRTSSRFKPGGSNSTNGLVSSPHHDQSMTLSSNGPDVETHPSNSAFRHGLSPLNTRNLVM